MQREIVTSVGNVTQILNAFEEHLKSSGKVCPRPWYWERFFILFRPAYEPPWLSVWWETSVEEKKDLFLKQIQYLAYQTNHFYEAYQFLDAIGEENWLFE